MGYPDRDLRQRRRRFSVGPRFAAGQIREVSTMLPIDTPHAQDQHMTQGRVQSRLCLDGYRCIRYARQSFRSEPEDLYPSIWVREGCRQLLRCKRHGGIRWARAQNLPVARDECYAARNLIPWRILWPMKRRVGCASKGAIQCEEAMGKLVGSRVVKVIASWSYKYYRTNVLKRQVLCYNFHKRNSSILR
jgi:hypothetical protein